MSFIIPVFMTEYEILSVMFLLRVYKYPVLNNSVVMRVGIFLFVHGLCWFYLLSAYIDFHSKANLTINAQDSLPC